jgi:hypothetical protein
MPCLLSGFASKRRTKRWEKHIEKALLAVSKALSRAFPLTNEVCQRLEPPRFPMAAFKDSVN